jgi:AcrR family transcriptional regulator
VTGKSSTKARPARGAPRGRDIARAGVPEIQRARILAALIEVARERGAGRVTVAHVVERSGVSRRTFYELFADRDACFAAAFEEAIERAARRVVPAFGRSERHAAADAKAWRERMRAGLLALLEFLDEEPGLGGLCVVDTLGAGRAVLEARARVVNALIDAVAAGAAVARGRAQPSRLTAEGVVGGVLSVLYARIAAEDPRPLAELLNPLMGMIVLPYLGAAAAARELARAAPAATAQRLSA